MISTHHYGLHQTGASRFFERIKKAGVKKVDVRRHNTSRLAGFAKADDLSYFFKEICGVDYSREPLLAPTDDILKAYKRDKGDGALSETVHEPDG